MSTAASSGVCTSAAFKAKKAVYTVVDLEKKRKDRAAGKDSDNPVPGNTGTSGSMHSAVSKRKEGSPACVTDPGGDSNKSKAPRVIPYAKRNSAIRKATLLVVTLITMLGAMVLVCFAISLVAINGVSSLKSELTDLRQDLLPDDQQELLDVLRSLPSPGQYDFLPTSSCAALRPSSPSGYYWVRDYNSSSVRVYCNMTLSCGGVTGGWTRVAGLDMTDNTQQCPRGLRQRNDDNIRTCVRNEQQHGCSSIITNFEDQSRFQYSRVCGRVTGFQYGTTNAFAVAEDGRTSHDINESYVDGVSITRGNPKEHIWTFAASLDKSNTVPGSSCPCATQGVIVSNSRSNVPSFVGEDYFCDTGSEQHVRGVLRFYSEDPLWDGAGCRPQETCCSFNDPPWFYKKLPQPTSDNVDIRLCRDESSMLEDVAVQMIDIYVQ